MVKKQHQHKHANKSQNASAPTRVLFVCLSTLCNNCSWLQVTSHGCKISIRDCITKKIVTIENSKMRASFNSNEEMFVAEAVAEAVDIEPILVAVVGNIALEGNSVGPRQRRVQQRRRCDSERSAAPSPGSRHRGVSDDCSPAAGRPRTPGRRHFFRAVAHRFGWNSSWI